MSTTNGNVAVDEARESVPMAEDGFLTRDAIFSANDQEFETVDVPEWGGRVRVKALSGQERDFFEESIVRTNGKNRELNLRNARAKLVALSVVDGRGQRIFENHDVAQLGQKSAAALERVYATAARLSGLTEKDAQELAGNLDDGQPGDSFSD